jgi:GTP-binding protein Era
LEENKHYSGFVSIIGKPNAGKSTLLNAILGRKLSIITPKASTTRHRILGIAHGDNYQMVFSDTPGVIKPKYELHNKMMSFVNSAVEDADLIVLVIAVDEKFPEAEVIKLSQKPDIPKILVLNKIDLADPKKAMERLQEVASKGDFVEQIAISATENFNVDSLQELFLKHLPEGPPYFDKDQLSDRPERFFVAEIIREKAFNLLRQEIPYSTEIEIEEFVEEEEKDRIRAIIHVERKSQQGMVIGKGGKMIKRIGIEARKDIEEFLGNKVHLELFVKVSDNWKNSNRYLNNFGYNK